jgi:hypothetical protein
LNSLTRNLLWLSWWRSDLSFASCWALESDTNSLQSLQLGYLCYLMSVQNRLGHCCSNWRKYNAWSVSIEGYPWGVDREHCGGLARTCWTRRHYWGLKNGEPRYWLSMSILTPIYFVACLVVGSVSVFRLVCFERAVSLNALFDGECGNNDMLDIGSGLKLELWNAMS